MAVSSGQTSGSSFRQHAAQLDARLEYLRLRRALGNPEQLTHLFVVESFHVVQDECLAASLRQARDGPLEIDSRDGRLARRRRLEQTLIVERIGQLPGLDLPAADEVQAVVQCQPVQPGSQRRLALEASELPVRLEKDLLQEVFALVRRAGHTAR